MSKLASVLGVFLVTSGLGLAYIVTQHIRFGPDQSTVIPATVRSVAPDLRPIAALLHRQGKTVTLGYSRPVRTRIPVIGVDAPVMKVGLVDGSVGTPPLSLANMTGWFDGSVTPGQVGPSLIAGHVNSAAVGPEVFSRIKDLTPGDRIFVTRADGRTVVFRVQGVQGVAKTDFPWPTVLGATSYPALRLVTCGGPFDYSTGRYLDNIIVYAAADG